MYTTFIQSSVTGPIIAYLLNTPTRHTHKDIVKRNFNSVLFLIFPGMGRAIAVKLAELGAKVFGISRTQEDLDGLKTEVKYT